MKRIMLVVTALTASLGWQNGSLGQPPEPERLPPARRSFTPPAGSRGLQLQPVRQFYNPDNGDRVYSSSPQEWQQLPALGYAYAGSAFLAAARAQEGFTPLYRYSTVNGTHFMSTDPNAGPYQGAHLDGPVGFIATRALPGTRALHDLYDPDMDDHLYTAFPRREQAWGYQDQGIVGYVFERR
jgi:hypothetical protein